jgi:hypothetical protein
LTPRQDTSDPTNTLDRGPQPPLLPVREIRKKVIKRSPPLEPQINPTPNLRYVSVHDVLTSREDNSDPTDSKDKDGN